jgi:4-amino-4-deoxy-L-arabinose transferase-like glycosyltransferase
LRINLEQRRWLCLILLAAFALRLAWVLTHDLKDFDEYWEIASHLLAGRGFALPEDGRIAATHLRPPSYPLLLAGLSWLGASWRGIGVLQAALSAATCWFAYELGRHLFSQRVGLLAALLLALDFPLIVMTGWLLTETLYVFLLGGIAYGVIAKAWQTKHGALLIGLLAGAACLTRSEAWLYLVLLLLAVIVSPSLRLFVSPSRIGLAVTAAVLCVAPWLLRNHFVLGQTALSEPLLLDFNLYRGLTAVRGDSSDFGFAFYLALRRNRSFFAPQRRLEEPGVRQQIRKRILDEWQHLIRTRPFAVWRERLANLSLLWIYRGAFYLTDSTSVGTAWRTGDYAHVLHKLWFYLGFSLLPFALALWGSWQTGWRWEIGLLWLYPLTMTLLMIPLWADYRYGLAAHVMLAPLIAAALKNLGLTVIRAFPKMHAR